MAYNNFALLYDDLMKDAPYDQWTQFTLKILRNRQVNQVVDLGCGTGEITLRLAEQEYSLFGVDVSPDMLAIAEQKALQNNKEITWIKQDIRTLEGFSNIDVFISYCDVINYIVEKSDVKRVFTNVYDSLSSGGLFIFDVHSLNHVEQNLTNNTFTYVDESLAYIWYCVSGDEKGEMYHDMTFFYKENENDPQYNRIDELHHQRTYSVDTYINLLKDVQFKNIKVYSDFLLEKQFSERQSERIFIVAEK